MGQYINPDRKEEVEGTGQDRTVGRMLLSVGFPLFFFPRDAFSPLFCFIKETWLYIHTCKAITQHKQTSRRMSQCQISRVFSSFPRILQILWQMSTVQAHWVVKSRFIRLMSILIKTLTPPYVIKGPRHLFSPREERQIEPKSGPEHAKGKEIQLRHRSPVWFTITALGRRLPITALKN